MKKLFAGILSLLFAAGLHSQIIKSGDITSSQTWTNDNIYILSGFVYVKAGATLTIQPGTVVKGDFNSKGALIIERDAKIIADGTPERPIVFTSQKAPGQRAYGDWGGVIICGKGAVNQPANPGSGTQQGEAVVEGGVGTIYGGGATPDNSDNSGIIRYVRIEFGGIPFQPNSEINGLTLCGVGNGTVIEHVQTSYIGDDAFEWFGGAVNAKYLVAYRNWDDDFDTDFGYGGNLQFGLSVRDPQVSDQSGSNGFESDNDASGTTNTPVTSPVFSNFTVIGPYATTTTIGNNYKRALHLRRNTRTSVFNSVFVGYPIGLLIDGSAAHTNATNGDMEIRNMVLAQMSDSLSASSTLPSPNNNIDADGFNISSFYNTSGWDNQLVNSVGELFFKNVSYTDPDFTLLSNSPLLAGASFTSGKLQSSFFNNTIAHRGAFSTTDWTDCWAEWDPQTQPYNDSINYSITASVNATGSTTICQGSSVTLSANSLSGASYLWSNGETTPSISVSTANTYKVTVISARGCSAISSDVTVTVNPAPATPTVTPSGSTSFCTGDSIQLMSSYTSGNVWSTGSTAQSIYVSASATYTVTHTDANGCQSTSNPVTTSVSSTPKPTISINGDLSFCTGDSVTLSASASDTYSWSNGQTTHSITVLQSGNYTVSVTNADACNGTGTSDAVAVTAYPNPVADATVTQNGLLVTFTNASSGETSYLWDFGDGDYSIQENPVHEYAQGGNYTVTLTVENANNCENAKTFTVGLSVGIEEKSSVIGGINLFPNPASGSATLSLNLKEQARVTVKVADIAGKILTDYPAEKLAAGEHNLALNLSSLNNGLYFVMIQSGNTRVVKRVSVNR